MVIFMIVKYMSGLMSFSSRPLVGLLNSSIAGLGIPG